MITLATLPQATAQEVFEQCAKHMIQQNRKSVSGTYFESCAYRGTDGCKCPAGALISDEEYIQDMEGNGWAYFNRDGSISPRNNLVGMGLAPSSHAELIREIQKIHDNSDLDVDQWKDELEMIGFRFKLDTGFLHEQA